MYNYYPEFSLFRQVYSRLFGSFYGFRLIVFTSGKFIPRVVGNPFLLHLPIPSHAAHNFRRAGASGLGLAFAQKHFKHFEVHLSRNIYIGWSNQLRHIRISAKRNHYLFIICKAFLCFRAMVSGVSPVVYSVVY